MSRVNFFSCSRPGKHGHNEDSYCADQIGDYHVFAVADGLGGHAAGETASGIAIACVKNAVKFCEGDIRTMLGDAVADAHAQILAWSEKDAGKSGMATTLIAACVDDDLTGTLVNVGDCRGHLITASGMTITRDHSYVNELIDAGEVAEEEALLHPLSHILTRALGDPEGGAEPDFYDVDLEDTFLLLSSDGLHDVVTQDRIRALVLENGEHLEQSARDLVREALAGGSTDDITVVMAHGSL